MRLALIFFLSVSMLLAGHRFGFAWAGGDGYEPPLEVRAGEGTATADRDGRTRLIKMSDELFRGETISTGDGERVMLAVGDFSGTSPWSDKIQVVLDERTAVTLDGLKSRQVTLRLARGRIAVVAELAVAEQVVVSTGRSDAMILENAVSVVNYDWLRTVQIIPFDTAAAVSVGDEIFATSGPYTINESEPVSFAPSEFNASAGPVADFYRLAEMLTGYEFFAD